MENVEILEQKADYNGLINSININPDEFLLPLHEVIVNAIQSIEDRNNSGEIGSIIIKVIIDSQIKLDIEGYEDYKPITGFIVTDNGVGFIDEREKAFSTPYTQYNIKKGGKGMGRYTVLACFGSMEIESHFRENNENQFKKYKFDTLRGLQKFLSKNDSLNINELKNKTIIKLNSYLPNYYKYALNNKINLDFIASSIIQHCLLYFINEDLPTIRLMYEEQKIEDAIVLNDIYKQVIEIEKINDNFNINKIKDNFKLSYIRDYSTKTHAIHLCANKRQVGKKQTLTNFLPSLKEFYNSKNEKYYLSIYVESDFLDKKNSPQRDKLLLPEREENKNTYDEIAIDELYKIISYDIKKEYSDFIEEAEKEKSERIKNYILNPDKPRLRYRHLLGIDNVFYDIPINASDETLEARLHEKEFRLEQKRVKAFQKIEKKKEYDKEEFGKIVHNILREEAAFSKDKLADLMIKRKSIIMLLKKYLEWRNDENYMLEEDLHNIIFTMGAETDLMPTEYHNLWLLDERFSFHTYTTSDKQIRTSKYFESDSQKETDLLIYDFPWAFSDNPNNINSLVIFEFKRPGRDMNTSEDKKLDLQVDEYFQKLQESKSKSNKGRFLNIDDTTPKFGYIICDLHNDLIEYNVKKNYFKKTPHGTLYKINPELNLYFEVMSYDTMVEFAEKRHNMFFKALGIDNL